jgi:hypothetical protein
MPEVQAAAGIGTVAPEVGFSGSFPVARCPSLHRT